MRMGKQVPPELLRQIQEDNRKEIEEDSFNNFNKKHEDVNQDQHNVQHNVQHHVPMYQNFVYNNHISKQMQRPPPNKFSPQYAAYVGAKPRAQASVRVHLGGVYK